MLVIEKLYKEEKYYLWFLIYFHKFLDHQITFSYVNRLLPIILYLICFIIYILHSFLKKNYKIILIQVLKNKN